MKRPSPLLTALLAATAIGGSVAATAFAQALTPRRMSVGELFVDPESSNLSAISGKTFSVSG